MRRLLVVALLVAACSPSNQTVEPASSTTQATTTTTTSSSTTTSVVVAFSITSGAFENGGAVPVLYTCDGGDVSPPLQIEGIPQGTESLVLIVDDPDAPTGKWDHWVAFDIPVTGSSLTIPADARESTGTDGVNSWHLSGYMGPCPPEGSEHQYSFRIYALSDLLDLPAGVTSDQVYEQMDDSVIESSELVGIYGR